MAVKIVGIVNITAHSFSDGGRFLDPSDAIAQSEQLLRDGADYVELGPAPSNPDAPLVSASEERRRLLPVLDALPAKSVAIDSCLPDTHRLAIEREVAVINDITGFSEPAIWPYLSEKSTLLVLMHSVQHASKADRRTTDPALVWTGLLAFFDQRIAALEAAGVARSRLILDPGMGFFLGQTAASSLSVIRRLPELIERYQLPILISVSRKSFLGEITGRSIADRGAATLAAELLAVQRGATWIRTHDVRALRDALRVMEAIRGA